MSTQFKGTPGEWYLQEYSDAYTNIVRSNQGSGFETIWVCAMGSGSSKENQYRYDALLISHSKKMLETLNKFLEIHGSCDMKPEDDMHEYAHEVRELIKAATELK